MSTRKELGKIRSIRFGFGGYQDAMMGLGIEIGGSGWGVGVPFVGTWSRDPDSSCKWTREDQDGEFAKAVRVALDLLRKAKKHEISELVGTPVECEFDGQMLKSWRILEEVL